VSPDAEIWVAFAALSGLFFGSFLNVCALRWPQEESVIAPGSRCPTCGTPLRWNENLPLFGWLWLRGRCRSCQTPISVQYPLVELATALLWGGTVLHLGVEWEAIRGIVFLSLLLGIALSDARFYLIPDPFSVGGLGLGLGLALLPGGIGFLSALAGAVLGFAFLWFVAWAGEKAFRKEAMGGGDIKMMAMVGAFLGSGGVFLTLFVGSFLGAAIFGPISFRTGKLVPFGVFLALGAAATYFFGDWAVQAYLNWVFSRI
jgi:leader peptidase (prepilin peptidase) / N-methyltransferase